MEKKRGWGQREELSLITGDEESAGRIYVLYGYLANSENFAAENRGIRCCGLGFDGF